MLVKEVAFTIHKCKTKEKYLAIKLDFSKAYDTLEWDFIREILVVRFPKHPIEAIMSCIITSRI